MKVLLIGNYPKDHQESMLRFALLLQRELEKRGHKVRLIQPQAKFNRFDGLPENRAKWLSYIDKFLCFGSSIRLHARWADVVHICDHSNAFYARELQNTPHLVTCHDVLAIRSALDEIPENPTARSGKILQSIILRGLRRSQKIICDSQSTQEQLLRISQIESSQVELSYISLNYPYSPLPRATALADVNAMLKRKTAKEQVSASLKEYVLHVGGNQWYKNRLGTLQIYDQLRRIYPAPPLVMVGKAFTPEMRDYIEQNKLQDEVIEIVGCADEELRALYSAAQCLLFPSLAEGFGWPVLEAQACGCPVFTSNQAPMTEVGGEAAIYFDPTQPQAAAQIVAQHLPTADAMRGAGFANLQRFTPDKMIDAYLGFYAQVIAEKA